MESSKLCIFGFIFLLFSCSNPQSLCSDETMDKEMCECETRAKQNLPVPTIERIYPGDFCADLKEFKNAAEQGDSSAKVNLGELYAHNYTDESKSLHFSADKSESLMWYIEAAKQGDLQAQNHLVYLYDRGKGGAAKDHKEAFYWQKRAAEQGAIKSQLELADRYYRGAGVKADSKKAYNIELTAAEAGNISAQHKLAEMFYYGKRGVKDYKIAFKWYKKIAESVNGSTYVSIQLSRMYQNGEGVSKDYDKALMWLKAAAETNNPLFRGGPEFELAKVYFDGVVTAQDYKQALYWYQKSAEYLNHHALFELGKIYQRGQGVTKDYLKAYINLQTSLGIEMRSHHEGTRPDEEISKIRNQVASKLTINQINKAKVDIFELLLQKGEQFLISPPYDVDSFNYLLQARWLKGYATLNVYGGRTDIGKRMMVTTFQDRGNRAFGEKNKEWLDRDQRYISGSKYQLNLSYIYFHGFSVKRDYIKALEWSKKAALEKPSEKHRGYNVVAMYLVAWMYDTPQGIPQDYKQAFDWYQKAADLGYGDAQLRLAEMYQQGQGVDQNNDLAIQWYKTAAEQGYNKAQRVLADLYRDGSLVEQDKKQAFEWYKKAAVLEELDAQYALAQMYATGDTVAKDNVKSYVFASYLAEQYENNEARKLSEQLTQKMTEVELQQAKTFGKQWLHDAKYRTLGVAVEPPVEW